jgi:hypothetical protein
MGELGKFPEKGALGDSYNLHFQLPNTYCYFIGGRPTCPSGLITIFKQPNIEKEITRIVGRHGGSCKDWCHWPFWKREAL